MGRKFKQLMSFAVIAMPSLAVKLSFPYPSDRPAWLGTFYDKQQNEKEWLINVRGIEEKSSSRYHISLLVYAHNSSKEDYPEFVRGSSSPLPKWNPFPKLFWKRSKITEVKTSSNYEELLSGVRYLDIMDGTGECARQGHQVTFHYELYEKGNFDKPIKSTYLKDQASKIRLGKKEVCPGLDEGIQGMRVNGIRRIIVPPDLSRARLFGRKTHRVYEVHLTSID